MYSALMFKVEYDFLWVHVLKIICHYVTAANVGFRPQQHETITVLIAIQATSHENVTTQTD